MNIRNKALEILDRPLQPFLELDYRLPAELLAGQFNVGAVLVRVRCRPLKGLIS
jgi:hypothetical protein